MSRWHHERRNEATANLAYAQLSPEELAARQLEEAAVRCGLLVNRLDTVRAALDHEGRLDIMAHPIEWAEPPTVSPEALVEWTVI